MKKLTIILGAAFVLALTSCSKEKTCECTTSTTGMDDVITTVTIDDGDCSDSNSTTTQGNTTVTFSCKEK